MALCLVPGSGGSYVASAVDPSQCSGVVALSSVEYSGFLSNLANFGWDQAAFEIAVGGGFLMFVAGFGIGLILNTIRRIRTI